MDNFYSVNNPPLVTVFTLVYNTGRYVMEALESIKAQKYQPIQHIIIDDCSVDDSVQILNSWIQANNYECTFIKHTVNQGITKTLNEVLALAKGKYIIGISDDVWLPEKLSHDIKVLEESDEEVGVLYSDSYIIDEQGVQKPNTLLQTLSFYPNMPEGYLFKEIMLRNFIPALSAVTKIECFKVVGTYDESLVYEDWDMWLRIALKYKFKYTDKINVQYRVHSNSAWNTRGAKFLESTLKSQTKFLGVDPVIDEIIRGRIVNDAEHIYKMKGSESSYWLKEKLKIDRKLSSAIFYISSLLKIEYGVLMGFINYVKNIKIFGNS